MPPALTARGGFGLWLGRDAHKNSVKWYGVPFSGDEFNKGGAVGVVGDNATDLRFVRVHLYPPARVHAVILAACSTNNRARNT